MQFKVFLLITGLENNGAEGVLFNVASSFPTDQCTIISLTSLGFHGKRLRSNGYTVHELRLDSFKFSGSTIKRFRSIITEINDRSILHSWLYHSDFFSIFIKLFKPNIRVIWCIRNSNVDFRSLKFTSWLVARLNSVASKFVPEKIVYCANSARSNHERIGFCPKRGLVIENGIDYRRSFYFRQSVPMRSDKTFNIGWVGRDHPDKGLDRFIALANYLRELHGNEMRFLVCGVSSPKAGSNIENSLVEFRGRVTDMALFYCELDLLVCTSRAEGFSNSVLEGKSFGLRVVAFDVGDISAILTECDSLVVEGDLECFARKVYSVYLEFEENPIAFRHGFRGRVNYNFSLDKMLSLYSELYNDICFD